MVLRQRKKNILVNITDVGLGCQRISKRGEYTGIYNPCFFRFENRACDTLQNQLYSSPQIVWVKRFFTNLTYNPDNIIIPSSDYGEFCEPIKILFGQELPQLLFQQAITGKIDVYAPKIDGSPNFSKKLTLEQVKKAGKKTEKVWFVNTTPRKTVSGIYNKKRYEIALANPNEEQEGHEDSITTRIDPKEIHYLRINQSWYFDKKKFALESKINSVAILQKNEQVTGEFPSYKPLFWVKFNN